MLSSAGPLSPIPVGVAEASLADNTVTPPLSDESASYSSVSRSAVEVVSLESVEAVASSTVAASDSSLSVLECSSVADVLTRP